MRAMATPSTITADSLAGTRPLSFPRLIQPILDSKCISCHTGGTRINLQKGTVDSYGWFTSYTSLRPYVFLFDTYYSGSTHDYVYPRTEPTKFGSKMSSLYTTYLKNATHNSLTTTSEKHAFRVWLDSQIAPFYGEYNNTAAQRNGDQVEPLYD